MSANDNLPISPYKMPICAKYGANKGICGNMANIHKQIMPHTDTLTDMGHCATIKIYYIYLYATTGYLNKYKQKKHPLS